MSEIKVRTAQPEDEDAIVEALYEACDENGLFEPDERLIRNHIKQFLNLDNGIIGVIGNTEIEGLVILSVSTYWYSDSAFLEEYVTFVRPKYRAAKGGRARKLVEFAKRAAEKLSLPLLYGILSNERTVAKTKLYQRHLGNPAGAIFLYGGSTSAKNMVH